MTNRRTRGSKSVTRRRIRRKRPKKSTSIDIVTRTVKMALNKPRTTGLSSCREVQAIWISDTRRPSLKDTATTMDMTTATMSQARLTNMRGTIYRRSTCQAYQLLACPSAHKSQFTHCRAMLMLSKKVLLSAASRKKGQKRSTI